SIPIRWIAEGDAATPSARSDAPPGRPCRRGASRSVDLETQHLALRVVDACIQIAAEMQLVFRPVGHIADTVTEIKGAAGLRRLVDEAAVRQRFGEHDRVAR